MIGAGALLLVHHAAHMLWLIRPANPQAGLHAADAAVLLGFAAVWGLWFAAGLKGRPAAEPVSAAAARAA
jgi:hypothetical protein